MAILDATNRARTLAQIVRDIAWPGLTKPNIKAAVDAVDDWAEANATSFNNALPVPFRTTATAAQKALILAYVCMRRAGILKAQEDL
jgi:hypothetical protein